MKKISRLITLIVIQSLLLVNGCFAGDIFIKEAASEVQVNTLSPQLTLGVSGFVDAMYHSLIMQEREFKTPEFISNISPEEFKAQLADKDEYGHSWVFMDFEQTLVNENISTRLALRSIKRAFTNEPNIFKKPLAFIGRFFKVLYLYYQWKTTKSIEAGIATFEGITKKDVREFAESLTLNETTLYMLKQLKGIMGKHKQNVVIVSRSTQDLLKAFFSREDIAKTLGESYVQVPFVCSNASLFNDSTGIDSKSKYAISIDTKYLYLPKGNLYIADYKERDVRDRGIKAFFVEDFEGASFERFVYYRLQKAYQELEAKSFDNLAKSLLTPYQFKKFEAVKNYYDEGIYKRLIEEAGKVKSIIRTAPMLTEVYGIGFPFYGNVNIHERMAGTLNRLKRKEISPEKFLKMIAPDLDCLIVAEHNDKGPWDISENMDERLKDDLIGYVTKFRRQWSAINAQMQKETIMGDLYADRDYAIDMLIHEQKLLLDIVFVPNHIWNEMPVFVMQEDTKYFKFIRDLLFSLNSSAENKSEVPEEFMHNYVLNFLGRSKKITRRALLEKFFQAHPYRGLIELYRDSETMVREKFISAIELAKSRGMIREEKGTLYLSRRGVKYLDKILNRRKELLLNGYEPEGRESFITQYKEWIEKINQDAAEEESLSDQVIKGTRNSLHVKQKAFKEMLEGIEDGTEIHFAAPGGGGDTLGTIFLIKILKHMFFLQGKKHIKFKIIFPSIKYGKENPFGGDIKIDQVKGITPIAIEGEAQSHFYTISKELKARIPIEDNNGNQLIMNGKPVFYEKLWSEGNILDLADKDGIELIMMDMAQKASDLKKQYLAMKKGKKVVTFYGDMGGDSLAQIPGKINDNNHTEVTIASPVSDLTGLLIFDGPAWILALGGDGESLERTQRTHLTTLFEKGQIAALFDTENYLRERYADENDPIDIFTEMDEYARRFSSEVSKNLFRRHRQVSLDTDMQSTIKKYGPWNYPALLRTDERLQPTTLRYEKREEYLSRYYLSALVVDSTKSMRENVQTKEVLREDITWAKRKKLLRKLNYATEGISFVVYRSKIKNFSDMFFEMLMDQEASAEELIGLFFNEDFSIELRLAAIRALYRNTHFVNGGERITKEIGGRLIELMRQKQNNVFLIAEVAKTMGIIGYEEAIDILRDFLEHPKDYGYWPFLNLYFYSYAKRRIIDTAERSLRMLIEKVLSRDGAEKALLIFNKVNGTHPMFKELKDRIELRMRVFELKDSFNINKVVKETSALEFIGQAV